jgi:hypothetical protein
VRSTDATVTTYYTTNNYTFSDKPPEKLSDLNTLTGSSTRSTGSTGGNLPVPFQPTINI